ncbi:MAG TPA: hypothetical protein VGG39_15940 [Polyangiaceae bacterium]|jgi:hypothetical protein
MIIVTGTKRSGTSLWMQILIAAGIPYFGEAFPRDWETTLKEANKEGFYESMLRAGIYFATNPHPKSGAYFFPEQVEGHCVKVFIPGLVRTDRAYIGRVIASVRAWREYEASLQRLYTMEDVEGAKSATDFTPPERMPPALEWWSENFALIRDVSIRRYPFHAQSYDGLLRDPDRVIRDTLQWLGAGDAEKALSTPKPQHRNFHQPTSDSVPARAAEVFDELYDAIDRRRELTPRFLLELNQTNELLTPLLREHGRRMRADAARRRAQAMAAGKPADAETAQESAAEPAEPS